MKSTNDEPRQLVEQSLLSIATTLYKAHTEPTSHQEQHEAITAAMLLAHNIAPIAMQCDGKYNRPSTLAWPIPIPPQTPEELRIPVPLVRYKYSLLLILGYCYFLWLHTIETPPRYYGYQALWSALTAFYDSSVALLNESEPILYDPTILTRSN